MMISFNNGENNEKYSFVHLKLVKTYGMYYNHFDLIKNIIEFFTIFVLIFFVKKRTFYIIFFIYKNVCINKNLNFIACVNTFTYQIVCTH